MTKRRDFAPGKSQRSISFRRRGSCEWFYSRLGKAFDTFHVAGKNDLRSWPGFTVLTPVSHRVRYKRGKEWDST